LPTAPLPPEPVDQSIDQLVDQPIDQSIDQPIDQPVGQPVDRQIDQLVAEQLRCADQLLSSLGMPRFRQRPPWWGPDLQTLRDTLRPVALPAERGQKIEFPLAGGDRLLALLDKPLAGKRPRALVLLLHGLGGSSEREGLRRMALTLQSAQLAVLRLNLRGADPGRQLAPGTYAANCNADLLPVLAQARQLAQELGVSAAALPLLGVGISLGGTMLLNACLAGAELDGLVCTSSPLDLADCSAQIELPRNRIYQRWLLRRLIAQTLADPFGISPAERQALDGPRPPCTIRAFDAAITAPRWGYGSVEHYYAAASPLAQLQAGAQLPPTLLLHALDDPWVPAAPALSLTSIQAPALSPAPALNPPGGAAAPTPGGQSSRLRLLITRQGGHNGFHGQGDGRQQMPGCWGDRLTARWLQHQLDQNG
jgi:predicted alpha/beta-fold hydrolase